MSKIQNINRVRVRVSQKNIFSISKTFVKLFFKVQKNFLHVQKILTFFEKRIFAPKIFHAKKCCAQLSGTFFVCFSMTS